ncbi:MAG: LamG domain-containing protein [Candidatus Kapaibacterium sp.]
MKYSILFLSVLLLFSCKESKEVTTPAAKVCIPETLEGSLLAYYPFIDGSLDDQKGNNNLTNTNNAETAEGREGGANCAYKFNGSTPNYLFMEDPTFLNDLRKFSISLWYKHSITNDGSYEVLISRGDENNPTPAANRTLSLGIYDVNKATFFNNMNSVWDNSNSNALEQWYHVVATCNFDTKTMTLYQNGKQMDQQISITQDVINPVNMGDLIIGRFFNGTIDDIAIFNKELTQEEVLELYSIESCCE